MSLQITNEKRKIERKKVKEEKEGGWERERTKIKINYRKKVIIFGF